MRFLGAAEYSSDFEREGGFYQSPEFDVNTSRTGLRASD
jgi:hypothetical protein